MNPLVEIAFKHIGLDKSEIKDLFDFYNEECIHLLPSNKRYVMPYGAAWCGLFASVVARKAGYGRNEFPYGVSVYEMASQAKQWGIYSESCDSVKVGDLIVFDWLQDGSYSHIGIVQGVSEDSISTIEGNYSGTVKERFIKRNARAIKGIISLGGIYMATPVTRLESLAERVMLGEFGNGSERVKALGSDYEKVQAIVNRLIK